MIVAVVLAALLGSTAGIADAQTISTPTTTTAAAALSVSTAVPPQATDNVSVSTAAADQETVRARIEALERQIQNMKAQVETLQVSTKAPAAIAVSTAASTPAPVVRLSGILFIGDPKEVLSTGTPDVKGVVIKVPFLEQPDFRSPIENHLGRPLTQAEADDIAAAVEGFYQSQGQPMVDVSLPPQEITGGVLQVLVLAGRIGAIKVQGNRWFSSRLVSSQVRARPGQIIDPEALAGDVEWLNRNPFRSVDLVYEKGAELGSADLVLREQDSFPVRVYGGFEDSGTPTTGNDRALAGLNWGNVFGRDGQFNYQYMADPTFRYLSAHSASLTQPLPWRNTLTVFGSYVDTRGDVPAPFDLKGFNDQASLRYEVPLPEASCECLRLEYHQALSLGFDYKQANNDLAFGGTKVYGAVTDTLQWSLGYNASLMDAFGQTALRSTLYYSPGNWSGADNSAVYGLARSGATARYEYANVELDRTTGLLWGFTFFNRFTFQLADANLLASEQMGFGGYDTIRGYDTRVINGDEGYILNNEVRTPPVGLLRLLGLKSPQDRFQFLGFFDYGMAADHTLLPGEAAQTYLASAGPGLRYAVSSNLTLRADYGWQLLNVNTFAPGASRGHFGLVLSF